MDRRFESRLAGALLLVYPLLACRLDGGGSALSEAGDTTPALRGWDGGTRFDGGRALRHLVELVERGGRHLGAEKRADALIAMEADFAALADRVERQTFDAVEAVSGERYELVNVVVRWRPDLERRALLATHWDTRRRADQDPEPSQRLLPVPGANDGTSGVAVLAEVLRVLVSETTAIPGLGVDVVLFDGEELGAPGPPPCCPGSRHFARHIESIYSRKPAAAIVLDMVGGRDLRLRREAGSELRARWLNDLVWRAGRQRAPRRFVDDIQPNVLDDHLALLGIGIPAVLLIDLDYGPWHTRADTPDQVSAESLETVGSVVLDVLAELARGETVRGEP